MNLVPVDHDPFAAQGAQGFQLVPVDHDPFADEKTQADPSTFQKATDLAANIVTGGLGTYASALGAGAATALKNGSFSEGYNKELGQHPVAADAGKGTLGGTAVTLAAKGLSVVPGPVGAIGKILSATPVMNAVSGATSEMSRGAVERMGGGTGTQFVASLLGGLGPVGAKGVVGAGRSLLSQFYQAPEAIAPAAEKLAAKNVADVLARDKINPASAPVDQNILQSGGKGATARAEAIATRGGEGADRLADYAANQRTALPATLSEALGKPFSEANYPAILEGLKQKAKQEAKPAYDAAYDALTKVNDPKINKALDRIVASGKWKVLTNEANELAALEGRKLGNIDATGMVRSYSTQDLDYMTRALRNLGQSTEGMGAFGNKTPIGAARTNVAGEIRGRLKELNPAFKDATENYADDIALHDAAETGKSANLFGSNWKQSVVDYNSLNPMQQKAWRIGQAENLQTMIANTPGSALMRMNSPQFAKVMQNFYSPDEYQALMGSAQQALKETRQVQQIGGNSRTVARALQQTGDAADDASLTVDALRQGPKSAVLNRITEGLVNRFSNTPVRQAADKQVAETLLSSPFNLAGRETAGGLSPMMQNALTGNPLVAPEVTKRLQLQRFIGNGMLVPPINYLLYSPYGEQ